MPRKYISMIIKNFFITGVLALLFFTLFLCYHFLFKSNLWTEYEFCSNGKYVLFYPEPNLILIFTIDKQIYPADWDNFQPSVGSGFRVSGMGPSNAHDATYGTLYYSSRYNWPKNVMNYSVLSCDFHIVRGEYLNCHDKIFHINNTNPSSPTIIVFAEDGTATKFDDIPLEIIPGLTKLKVQYGI